MTDTLATWISPPAETLASAPVIAEQIWTAVTLIGPRIKRATNLVVIGILIFLGVYFAAGGLALPHIQAAIYQTFAARIHAERPLYHSSLSADDGGWLDNPSTAQDGIQYRFADGSYQLQSGGYVFLESLRRQVYGDVAVEVTFRMPAPASDSAFVGVGLLLHQGSGGYVDAHQVAFTITNNGTWSASNFNLSGGFDTYATHDQRSAAIRTATGATNALLVLIRGHQFICFVNDQYVGSYYEVQSYPGYVGVINDALNRTVSFTNFTIYPAIESDW